MNRGGDAALTDPTPPGDLPPLLTVLKGGPTPEQLAALVAVVCSLRPLEEDDDEPLVTEAVVEPEPSLWGAPALRGTPAAGPGGWRSSGLPHPP